MTGSRFAHWLVYLTSLLLTLSGFAQSRPRIVVVTHGQASDPFWLVVRNGLEVAATETGSDVDYRSPGNFDPAGMAQLINAAVASKPDGLVVSIPDADALGDSIRAAEAAKIPVLAINAGRDVFSKLGCLMYIGQAEQTAGKQAGERLKAMGVKKAIVLNHEAGNISFEHRIRGFRDGFEGPFHHVEVLPVTPDFGECQAAVATYLQAHDEVNGILALGPVTAEAALEALDELGRLAKVKLCTFDISPAIVQALLKRRIAFAVDQQQWLQGYLAVVVLATYAKYGCILQNNLILTGPSFVTPETAERMVNLRSLGFRNR
ncbi:MAG: sugar ABC transporter substrate-binding protein [Verrucomicrobia bacterium]|nr:sugar ABC transporter substrate-binding protein [Verrucomicrobiota bacterium]